MNLTPSISNNQNNVIINEPIELSKQEELNEIRFTSLEEELFYYKKQLEVLTEELELTKDKLKKYTAPERNKLYYQKNKEKLQTPEQKEKRKEINKRAYEKRKQSKPSSVLHPWRIQSAQRINSQVSYQLHICMKHPYWVRIQIFTGINE